jgi:DNA-binding CsgD family transcriptional regulator
VGTVLSHPEEAEEASDTLAGTIQEWIDSMSELDICALVVLGPNSADELSRREVWAAHPPAYRSPAEVFAQSDAYGPAWRDSNSPVMAWQNVAEDGDARWRRSLLEHRVLAVVRCDMAMPFGAGYECVAFLSRHLRGRSEAFEIGWALNNLWPMLKRGVIESRFGLTDRAREVLRVLAEGHTAKQAADIMGLKERTVHFHLSTVMERLNAENRAAAILRACMLGIL